MTSLTQLHLYNTNITDEGLSHLRGLTGLVVLDIGTADIGDFGVQHLEVLTGLWELHLTGTLISHEGFAQLKRKLRKTKIYFE